MKTTTSVDAARVELMLTDLRLPAIKLMCSDWLKGGWTPPPNWTK